MKESAVRMSARLSVAFPLHFADAADSQTAGRTPREQVVQGQHFRRGAAEELRPELEPLQFGSNPSPNHGPRLESRRTLPNTPPQMETHYADAAPFVPHLV